MDQGTAQILMSKMQALVFLLNEFQHVGASCMALLVCNMTAFVACLDLLQQVALCMKSWQWLWTVVVAFTCSVIIWARMVAGNCILHLGCHPLALRQRAPFMAFAVASTCLMASHNRLHG